MGSRLQRDQDPQIDHGPNWSREEEEVSLTLRNLRGLAGSLSGEQPPRQGLQPPGRNPHSESCRYRIELDISRQF
jgi:hypothetical protein